MPSDRTVPNDLCSRPCLRARPARRRCHHALRTRGLGRDHAAPRRQFVRQMPQLGTGHAVQQAAPVLADDGVVVVLSGDVPLTQADTI